MGDLASGYSGTTEGQGELQGWNRGPRLRLAHNFTHPLALLLTTASPLSFLPLRKECLVSSSGNDNTENGLPGSKAEEKAPTKV